jgi:hypothetical protein
LFFADDQINSPEFEVLDRDAPRVKNGRYVIIPAGKESDGEANNDHAEIWGSYLKQFLVSLTPQAVQSSSSNP